MSQEDVELVRRSWEAWEGDMEAIFAIYDEDVVWDFSRAYGNVVPSGEYHGHDDVRQFFRRLGWLVRRLLRPRRGVHRCWARTGSRPGATRRSWQAERHRTRHALLAGLPSAKRSSRTSRGVLG